jgi:hypothetical protein
MCAWLCVVVRACACVCVYLVRWSQTGIEIAPFYERLTEALLNHAFWPHASPAQALAYDVKVYTDPALQLGLGAAQTKHRDLGALRPRPHRAERERERRERTRPREPTVCLLARSSTTLAWWLLYTTHAAN